ncbi:MAG: hypothetical protein WC822_02515 [Candidatus Paceibacterota bacterium]|jgi:hypothetical protein
MTQYNQPLADKKMDGDTAEALAACVSPKVAPKAEPTKTAPKATPKAQKEPKAPKAAPKAKVAKPPFRLCIGIVSDGKYGFEKRTFEKLADLFKAMESLVESKGTKGLRELQVSVHLPEPKEAPKA